MSYVLNVWRIPVDFTISIEEKNEENYLSAGEMPLPALYQMLCALFFLTGCFWVFILKKNGSQQVFRSVHSPGHATSLLGRSIW